MLAEVKIIGSGTVVHNGRVLKKGEVVDVDKFTALKWVEEGMASYTVECRALREVIVSNRNYSKGDLFVTSAQNAVFLHNRGCVEILDKSKAEGAGELMTPPPKEMRSPLRAPEPETVRVRVLKEFFHGSRTYSPDPDKDVFMQYPVSIVHIGVAAGIIEVAGDAPRPGAGVDYMIGRLSLSEPSRQ
jgi:hypothetical protein